MIKSVVWCLPACLLIAPAAAVQTPASSGGSKVEQSATQTVTLTVRDGTPVRLSLREDLNSSHVKAGQSVAFGVIEDVIANNAVVIPNGSPAVGHIVSDQHKGMVGKAGKLEIALDYISVGSNKVNVRATTAKVGQGSKGTAITLSVIASPLFLMKHGKEATIPKDTMISGYVNGDQKIQIPASEAITQVPSSPVYNAQPYGSGYGPASVAPQPTIDLPSDVNLKSVPPGAEISIDGEFVGDTPTVVKVSPGHHNIIVTKTGFKTWQRTLNVSPGGTVRLISL